MAKVDDSTTTIKDLRELQMAFVKERNWEKFQNMRSLAISVSLEANELLEHFQWLNDEEVLTLEKDKAKIAELSEEMADILNYILIASDRLGIDLSKVLANKIAKNRAKYPKKHFRKLTWEEDNKKYQELREAHFNKLHKMHQDYMKRGK